MADRMIDPDSALSAYYRHWNADSEKFTGCDALVTALESGWTIEGVVFRQEIWLSGVRPVSVFHFDLSRDDVRAKMRVCHNPFIVRLLNDLPVQVVAINQRKQEERVRFF
ncbi:MAG: hypothetical protein SGJ24_07695 [Chloroflexota bacterium]|nr:hypothetical protein [Chloroflexota bacterium]